MASNIAITITVPNMPLNAKETSKSVELCAAPKRINQSYTAQYILTIFTCHLPNNPLLHITNRREIVFGVRVRGSRSVNITYKQVTYV